MLGADKEPFDPRTTCGWFCGSIPVDTEEADPYGKGLREFAVRFEGVAFESIHGPALDLLPSRTGAVLDISAGTGRDAHWFAQAGWDVLAVEPSADLRRQGQLLHPHPRIRWLDDRLPGLQATHRLGQTFDLIWLSAVWMHVAPGDRVRAFRKIVTLLRPGGRLMMSLRHGPGAAPGRCGRGRTVGGPARPAGAAGARRARPARPAGCELDSRRAGVARRQHGCSAPAARDHPPAPFDTDAALSALSWGDPDRSTKMARDLAVARLNQGKPVYCVWSGRILDQGTLDIDHCLPWSLWPCEGLWNLMPAHSSINQHQKRDLLVSAGALRRAEDRIICW